MKTWWWVFFTLFISLESCRRTSYSANNVGHRGKVSDGGRVFVILCFDECDFDGNGCGKEVGFFGFLCHLFTFPGESYLS